MCHESWSHGHTFWAKIKVDHDDVYHHLWQGDFVIDDEHPCPPQEEPAQCPEGQVGTPPDCEDPQPEQCPEGQVGTPPDCTTPAPEDVCPDDEGVQTSQDECTPPPPEVCPEGQTGTPPDCTAVEPQDMCPDMEGVQASQDECPPPAQDMCPDIDGVQDSADECPPAQEPQGPGDTSGGGALAGNRNHGNGRSSNSTSNNSGGGEVLGEETSAPVCSEYLTSYIRFGADNDTQQVTRLQTVLKDFEGAPIEITGVYDAATLAAVNAFQLKYASEVLEPWGIHEPTGFVYLTTKKKINEVYCQGMTQFPLSIPQQEEIAHVRLVNLGVQPAVTGSQDQNTEQGQEAGATGNEDTPATSSTPQEEGGFWNGIWNWIRGR
jgi:hypothetical protein